MYAYRDDLPACRHLRLRLHACACLPACPASTCLWPHACDNGLLSALMCAAKRRCLASSQAKAPLAHSNNYRWLW